MEYLLSAAQMKECDRDTIERIGIPSAVLMERAALSVVEEMERSGYDLSDVLVICGSGNNGGDGFAVARILAERRKLCAYGSREQDEDGRVTVAFVGSEHSLTEEAARQRRICAVCGIKESSNFTDHAYTAIVDAMLGIGLSRNVEGRYAEIIRWINSGRAPVTAVDIPSGVSADSGRILGEAVRADLTVTFARRKPGQLLYPGAEYCGKLVCRQIGVTCGTAEGAAGSETAARETAGRAACGITAARETAGRAACGITAVRETAGCWFTCADEDLARLPSRRAYSNKGSYGKVLLIAGSRGMSGAACLAARAAFRSGCGMVRVFTPECNRAVIQTVLPEAMVTAWEPPEAPGEKLAETLAWSDAAGIGPGLGQSVDAGDLLSAVLREYNKPLVIDADGLNLLSGKPELLLQAKAPVIVTPHVGEMARLTKLDRTEIASDLPGCALSFARKYKVICVLKDARTVVSDGERVYINTSGNHGMASAGSGDVLTGLLCGLLGQGMQTFAAAVLGVYLHGRAGDLAREKTGACGMMARDLADQIGEALKIAENMQKKSYR